MTHSITTHDARPHAIRRLYHTHYRCARQTQPHVIHIFLSNTLFATLDKHSHILYTDFITHAIATYDTRYIDFIKYPIATHTHILYMDFITQGIATLDAHNHVLFTDMITHANATVY